MMSATIDGQSIYGTFGAVLSPDSISALLRYPTREAVRQTDFAESHGIQADLRTFKAQRRRVQLTFNMLGHGEAGLQACLKAFTDALAAPGWHAFDFGIGVSFPLRYVSAQSLALYRPFSEGENGATITVTMEEEEFPVTGGTPVPIGGVPTGVASIDGVDLSQFGASLDATYAGAAAVPADLKEPFNDGRKIYLDELRRKSAEWILYINLAARSNADFVRNWQALYAAFARPGLIPLYLREWGGTSQVFYRDCTAAVATIGTGYALQLQIKVVCPSGG